MVLWLKWPGWESQLPETSSWSKRVDSQLARILCSTEFKKSKRLRKFLTYVVSETLRGAKRIRSYNIAVEVFDKGEGFDPGDPYVRNIARQTRSTLKKYYATTGKSDDVRIDVPAGNYVATFDCRSVAEHSTDVVRDVSDGSHQYVSVIAANESIQNKPGLRAIRAVLSAKPTVAVIPFRYHGRVQNDESILGETMAGSTIAGLSRSPHINVISRLSTTRLRNVDWSLEKITSQLGCDYVMSGSYRCRNKRLVLLVELAECNGGEVLWSDELTSGVADLLNEQDSLVDELIHQTARSVIVHEIRRAATIPLESLAMHTQLLAGLHNMHSTEDKKFLEAKVRFESVLRNHPAHPAVNAQIAHWHVMKLNRGGGWDTSIEHHKKAANRYLKRALESDPYDPLALTINGLAETQFNRNPEKGLAIYNDALAIHPNEPLLYSYKAAVLSYKGEGEAAVECANAALQLSPIDPQLNMFHTCAAAAYYSINDFDKAEMHANRAFELNPHHTSNLRTLVAVQVDLGKINEAKKNARFLLRNDPKFTTRGYLARSPNAEYQSGRLIAERLERAGVPCE